MDIYKKLNFNAHDRTLEIGEFAVSLPFTFGRHTIPTYRAECKRLEYMHNYETLVQMAEAGVFDNWKPN